MADKFVVGHTFDGVTGLKTGADLEDLVALAKWAESTELLDQATLEDFDNGGVRCARVKAGGIGADQLGAGAVQPANLSGILAVHAHKNGSDQTISTMGTTGTKLTFGTEEFDIGGCFDSSRFTPNVEGIYAFRMRFGMSLDAGKYAIARIHKNGAKWKSGDRVVSGATGTHALGIAVLGYANGSTDYFEGYVKSDESLNFDVEGDADVTFFEARFVTTYSP